MFPDLERLIRLQQLENSASEARSKIDLHPNQLEDLNARMAKRALDVDTTKQRLADQRFDRQSLEKELASIQTRLSRFKEQLMEVKTNKEYQAMQIEMASAETEVRRLEDTILERMLKEDELAAEVAQAEQILAEEQALVAKERDVLEQERRDLEQRLDQYGEARTNLTSEVTPQAMALFETVSRQRKGVAVVETHNGHCSSCQVRLRPQLFNDIRSNGSLIQCESCQRILFYKVEQDLTL